MLTGASLRVQAHTASEILSGTGEQQECRGGLAMNSMAKAVRGRTCLYVYKKLQAER
jgi:hypothetical protein